MLQGRFTVRQKMVLAAGAATFAAMVGAAAPARQPPGATEGGSAQQRPGAAAGRQEGRTDAGETELGRQLKSLIAENERAYTRYPEGLKQLKTDGEKKAYISANWPPEKRVVGRMLELARRHPQDPASFDALAWVAILGYDTAESDEAAETLARRYGPEKRLWLICQEMRRGVISPARGILLRAVLEQSPDRATRGRACLDLAEYHAELASLIRILKTPGLKPWQAQA
jgi:hypothetical protein